MKRNTKALSLISLILLVALLFSSCALINVDFKDILNKFNSSTQTEDEVPLEELPLGERAEKVMDYISSRSDEEKSMDAKLEMTFEGMLLNGKEFTVEASGVSSYRYLENGEYQYLQTQSISTIVPGQTSDVSTHTMGYMDGKMFKTSVDSSLVTRVYSEVTKDEFIAHMDNTYGTSDLDLSDDDYEVISCEKINNKWVIEFSIYSERGVDIIQRELLSDVESLVAETHTISEIYFTVIADSEFSMTGYEIEAEFETVDDKYNDRPEPSLEFSVKVEDVLSPKPIDEIDFNKYTKVNDLRAFDTVNKALNDKINDDYSKIQSDVKTQLTVGAQLYYQEIVTSYDGYYQNTDDGFEYNLIYKKTDSSDDYNNATITIDYKNLTKVSDNGSYSQTENYVTDHEAKRTIDTLIDPVGITIDGLKYSSLYNEEDGIYKFEFENMGKSLGYSSETLGSSIKTDSASLDVVILDGELVSYSFKLFIETNSGVKITVTANCTYSE